MAVDDAGDDLAQVGVMVDVVELAGFDERGDGRPVLGAAVGLGEEGILAIEGERPNGPFDGVVVDVDAAVVEEQAKPGPARQGVADRLGELGFLTDQRELLPQCLDPEEEEAR